MRRPPPFSLRATAPRGRALVALARRLPKAGLGGVLADLDRTGRATDVPGDAAGRGFGWEPRDDHDPAWWPQGVACLDGDALLLVGWYRKPGRSGRGAASRVTVVDRTEAEHPRYRHVRLVSPRRPLWLRGLGPVRVHAGGIAVRDGLLYVADTVGGVRLFRLDDILRVPGPGGHEYVLPQWRRLRVPRRPGPWLRFSFLSLGDVEGRLGLVVGEYRRAGSAPRLVHYPLDPATGLPVAGDDGWCAPLSVHDRQPLRMQGVAVHGATWYVSASAGRGRPGDLHVGRPGAFRRHGGVLPTGPEDLDWAVPGRRLWCATEWPGGRWVFAIDAHRWPGPAPADGGGGPGA
jgi:hypothetical protein